MEKGFVENGFIIDLSNVKNTTQLVFELSSIMEHPDVKNKNICLKLGALDLKQSQLLSKKALIESMDAEIAFIDTTSEQTEASAISLGIIVSELTNEETPTVSAGDNDIKPDVVEVKEENISETTVEIQAPDINQNNCITTNEGVEDIYTEETSQILSEIIQEEYIDTDFSSLAENEDLPKHVDNNKYILLDTGDAVSLDTEINTVLTETLPTLYISQTLRSGQTINYDGNILIIGDAHPGSEIVATGDITVWGILGGIAHAGSKGNLTSKVRALKLNAIQLRIANLYARRNDTLNVPYVQKTNEFTPEEALIEDGKIVIYKKLRRD